jgi:hypothetical protein
VTTFLFLHFSASLTKKPRVASRPMSRSRFASLTSASFTSGSPFMEYSMQRTCNNDCKALVVVSSSEKLDRRSLVCFTLPCCEYVADNWPSLCECHANSNWVGFFSSPSTQAILPLHGYFSSMYIEWGATRTFVYMNYFMSPVAIPP